MNTAMIHTRVDVKSKEEAKKVCDKLGISMSEAIRMFIHQIAARQELPLATKIPNRETKKALDKFLAGKSEYAEYTLEEYKHKYNLE
jgi:DNA-damage-inducible protein J